MRLSLSTTVADLYDRHEISTRLYKVFQLLDLETLEDVSLHEPQEMRSFLNFGKKCEEELKQLLVKLEVTLREDEQAARVSNYAQLSRIEKQIIHACYHDRIVANNSLGILYPDEEALHKTLCGDTEKLFEFYGCCDYEENMRIREDYIDYLNQAEEQLAAQNREDSELAQTYRRRRQTLVEKRDYLPYIKLYWDYLSRDQIQVLNQKNSELYRTLTQRPGNAIFAVQLNNTRRAVELFETPMEDYKKALAVPNLSEASAQAVHAYLNSLKASFNALIRQNDDEVRLNNLQLFYPILPEEANAFVQDYYRQNYHKPLLFMLQESMKASPVIRTDIYTTAHGLRDGQPRTNGELAKEYRIKSYTVEACRRNLQYDGYLKEILSDYDWHNYDALFGANFLTGNDPLVKYYIERENLPQDFSIAAWLLRIPGNYTVINLNDQAIAIKSELCQSLNWNNCEKTFKPLIKQGQTHISPSVSDVLKQIGCTESDQAKREEFVKIAQTIGTEIYGLSLDEAGYFHTQQIEQTKEEELLRQSRKQHHR